MSGSHFLSDGTSGAASSSHAHPHHAAHMLTSEASRNTPHTPSTSISLSNQYSASPTSPATPSETITQAELLSLVLDLKLKATNESTSIQVNTHTQQSGSISESTTAIDTLDLCHRKIAHLPDELVHLIKGDVVRLALGYNVIARLPDNFSQLSKLRYLNIRANMITTFPSVLCELPCLEILDISRNKIRKMPLEAGRLLNLRVLSMANNRLRRLPNYVGQMRHLRILKVEQNPLQWPPTSVSVLPPTPKVSLKSSDAPLRKADKEAASTARKKAEDRHMAEWIAQLKAYLTEHPEPAPSATGSGSLERKNTRSGATEEEDSPVIVALEQRSPPVERATKASAETQTLGAEEAVEEVSSYDTPASVPWLALAKVSAKAPTLAEAMALPKAAPSVPAVLPSQSVSVLQSAPTPAPTKAFERIASPPPPPATVRQVAPVPPVPAQFSPASSPQVGTPDSSSGNETRLASLVAPKQHGRNNSHSVGQPTLYAGGSTGGTPARRGLLRNKKSLPELRATPTLAALAAQELQVEQHEEVMEHHQHASYEDSRAAAVALPAPLRRPPLPHSVSAFSGTRTETQPSHARKMSLPEETVGVSSSASVDTTPARRVVGPRGGDGQSGRDVIATEDSGGIVEVERNSYFKRLSTLPPSTISKAVPVPVLKFVDATRGVLYALSQIYTALKQYILFATDDRLSGQFNRALDVASGSMGTLINSLDRFDSLSRRGTPEPSVIRGVLTAGRHAVVTFRKVVSVLHVQLGALQSTADVRYTRTLLLMLYGSMAEVGASWAVMAPQIDAVLPYLAQTRDEQTITKSATPAVSSAPLHVVPSLPSIAEATSPGLKQARPSASSASAAANRTQRRRHAGSFSAQDVAQGANIAPGATMPAFDHAELAAARRSVRAAAPAALGMLPNALPLTPASGWVAGTTFEETTMSAQQAEAMPPTTPNGVTNGPYTAGAVPGSYFNGYQAQAGTMGMSAPATSTRFPGLGSRSVTESSPLGGGGRNRRTPSSVSAGDAVRAGMMPTTPGTAHSVGSTSAMMMMPPMTPFTPYAHVAATHTRTLIDGHLVELVAQVTSVASGVWTAMLEHLASLGVRGANASSPTPDTSAFPSSGMPTGVTGGTQGVQRTRSRSTMSPTDTASGSVTGDEMGGAGASRRLRELRDLGISTGDLTRRLQSTLDKVQEEAEAQAEAAGETTLNCSAAESRRLVEQAAHFVKAIIAISQQVKSSSVEYPWPKPLLRSLGQLMSCARDLTIHLHVLAPTTSAARSATPVPLSVVQAVQQPLQQQQH